MELKRILAKDSRAAMETAMSLYGKDVLVVSSQSVAGQVELVVALDVQPEPPPVVDAPVTSAFTEAFRRALGPMPEPEPEPESKPESKPAFAPEVEVMPEAAPVSAAASRPEPWMERKAQALSDVTDAVVRTATSPVAESTPSASAVPVLEDALRGRDIVDAVRREIAALRQEFQLSRQVQSWQSGQPLSEALAPVVAALNEAGVPAGLRALLIDSAQHAPDPRSALDAMQALMADALAALPRVNLERGVHAVCGTSGVGKTLMVARLACDAAQRLGSQRVALVVFDDARSGAWSQMQVLAAQAGVSCYRAPNADTLRLLINDLGSRDLVLIDTAGADALVQAQRLQAMALDLQVHALLPADASIASVRRMLADGVAWSSVMVSKLDESESPWPLMQLLCDRQLPVSCTAASANLQPAPLAFDAQSLLQPTFLRLRHEVSAAVQTALVIPQYVPPAAVAAKPVKAKASPRTAAKPKAERISLVAAKSPSLAKPASRRSAARAAA